MITLCVILSFLSFTIGTDIGYPVEPTLVCKANEVLNKCPGYCTFDDTCAEIIFGLMRSCAAPPIDYKCQPRCDCKIGFVRTDSGCEPVEKCCTGINEEITNCPAPCDETCDGKPADDCRLSPCFRNGCRCKSGYVRDAKGTCIPKTQCVKCKENEEYSTCGTCERSCKNLNPICTFDCKVGCFCKDGFVRDDYGNCIAERMCPQNQCTGPNEEYSECINPCPPGAMCIAACIPGCVCKKGFVRKDGVCVKETPQGECTGPNEEYSDCIKFTCPPGRKCPAIACRPGCICKNGFVRKNGVCVKKIFVPKPTISPPIEIITFAPRPTPDEILKNQ